MYKIYIDTTQRFSNILSLVEKKDTNEKVLEEIKGDIDINYEIKRLLEKYNLTPENISEFNVNQGPGSFTGIKIGITISNTLNWATNKKSQKELIYPTYGKEPNIFVLETKRSLRSGELKS